MVDALLDFMLGRFRVISDFYLEYQMIFNSLVVGGALFKIVFSKRKTQNESSS
nr:hypothetical protein [Tuberibacillus sp. Marseille-P3662]